MCGYLYCCTYIVGFCFWFVGGLLFGGRFLVCLAVMLAVMVRYVVGD